MVRSERPGVDDETQKLKWGFGKWHKRPEKHENKHCPPKLVLGGLAIQLSDPQS
jgi:hypothetical protein